MILNTTYFNNILSFTMQLITSVFLQMFRPLYGTHHQVSLVLLFYCHITIIHSSEHLNHLLLCALVVY